MYFGAVTFNERFPDKIAVFPASTVLGVDAIDASTFVVFVHASVLTGVEVIVPGQELFHLHWYQKLNSIGLQLQ